MCWVILQLLNMAPSLENKWGYSQLFGDETLAAFSDSVGGHAETDHSTPDLCSLSHPSGPLPTISQNPFSITSNHFGRFRVSKHSRGINSGVCQLVGLCLRGRQY